MGHCKQQDRRGAQPQDGGGRDRTCMTAWSEGPAAEVGPASAAAAAAAGGAAGEVCAAARGQGVGVRAAAAGVDTPNAELRLQAALNS